MRIARFLAVAAFSLAIVPSSPAASAVDTPAIDSDHDGLSDAIEQTLLERFLPRFWVDRNDCAGLPAEFRTVQRDPVAEVPDGTIYGQATPRTIGATPEPVVELHYYHLWSIDCGHMGHPLDAEHVSVLIRASAGADGEDGWKALYWYAAAHEDTICDASQMTRAAALEAGTSGATVWISRGKHASFLRPELCAHGCGGDECREMHPLEVKTVINLGEAEHPMNGALWVGSSEWHLAAKMARSDFDPETIARVERVPQSDIVWVNPSLSPTQATIAAGGSTAGAVALADRKTGTALTSAGGATGSSLGTTCDKVSQSLKKSARGVGRFLRGDLRNARKKNPQPNDAGEPLPAEDGSGVSNR